jgi:hypothetical protein
MDFEALETKMKKCKVTMETKKYMEINGFIRNCSICWLTIKKVWLKPAIWPLNCKQVD